MGALVVTENATVDGVIEQLGDWFAPAADDAAEPDIVATLREQMAELSRVPASGRVATLRRQPSDPWAMLLTSLTLCAVAALACIVPARRAAHVDVMRTLSAS